MQHYLATEMDHGNKVIPLKQSEGGSLEKSLWFVPFL